MTLNAVNTLQELVSTRQSLTGYDLGALVSKILNNVSGECPEDVEIAQELNEKYFNKEVEEGKNYKPLKFVYYRIIRNQGEFQLRRNFFLSPRANGYFDTEGVTSDELRNIIRLKKTVLGKDLKRVVATMCEREFEYPARDTDREEVDHMSNTNLSIQLARYIDTFFISCEKPIKDDIWYGVTCKEYATATIYRDLDKSPRQHKDRKSN